MKTIEKIGSYVLAILTVAAFLVFLGAAIVGPIFLKAWIWKKVWGN